MLERLWEYSSGWDLCSRITKKSETTLKIKWGAFFNESQINVDSRVKHTYAILLFTLKVLYRSCMYISISACRNNHYHHKRGSAKVFY
jgi:hypothetical protein